MTLRGHIIEPEPALRLSNSKANTYLRCPRKYEYRYIKGLRPKAKALPLERGTWLHSLLETHYAFDENHMLFTDRFKGKGVKVGTDWKKAHAVLTQQFNNLFDEEKEDLGDLPADCRRIFCSYLARYGTEDRRQWKVIDTELDEIITLPSGLRFQIIIDLVVEDANGGIWIVDHKTVGRFMPVDFMLLDSQLARYFWGAEHMGYGPLRGIIYNEVNTTPPTLPKLLATKPELEKRQNLRCDVYTYLREIKRLGLEIDPHRDFLRRLKSQQDDWFRRTRLPKDPVLIAQLMKELEMTAGAITHAEDSNEFPRAASKDCTWGCEFLHACQLELMGGDASDIIKSRFTTAAERDL